MFHRTAAITALAIILFTPAVITQVSQPRVLETVDLGEGKAVAVNANGQVAIVGQYRSFLWSEGTGAIDLGGFHPDYPQTMAIDMNDRGQVTGRVLSRYGYLHPFIWSADTGLVDADPFIWGETAAVAINNAGEIVGGGSYAIDGIAFRRSADGTFTRRHPLGGYWSAAYDINMFGVAVGQSAVPGPCDEDVACLHAFTWTPSTERDLGSLGGGAARAIRINSLNQVAGESTTAAGDWHAVLWSDRTGMKDLGTLGGSWSRARAINEAGHVVGTSVDAEGRQRAFLWRPFDGMIDLGLGEAVAINEFDQVVGFWTEEGASRAFLWTPHEGRTLLADDARAAALNNTFSIVGQASISTGSRAVIWRLAETDADWLAYRYVLVDAYVAYGILGEGRARALRAVLRKARRAMEAGDAVRVQEAYAVFARRLSRWAPGELPWQ